MLPFRRALQPPAPSPDLLLALVEQAACPMLVVDPRGRVSFATPAAGRAVGRVAADLVGQPLADLVHPDDAPRVAELLGPKAAAAPARLICRLRRGDAWLDTEFTVADLRTQAAVGGLVLTVHNNAGRRLAEEALVHKGLHDALTGLPNRALLLDRLGLALARTDRNRRPVGVLFLDLDNFKVVNDSLGHMVGDLLLIETGHRLAANIRAGDTVARFGGDEFAVLLEDIGDADEATATAERLAAAVRVPVDVGGREVRPDASIGVAVSGRGRETPDDLLRRADLAMYAAKAGGKGRHALYSPSLQARANARMELETGLRRALERGELRLQYQPILSLESGRVTGFEALLRWARPGQVELVPPAEFVPVAEDIGAIVPIGLWVLETACLQLRRWRDQFPDLGPLTMAVNVSARQLRHPGLVADVRRVMRDTGVEPAWVTLEITESVLVEDAEATTAVLHDLKAVGVQLAIDDFGTGYSSLSYLRRLPVDTLKIDRSFITGLDDGRDLAIVRNILELAGTLRLTTTAEGIETAAQLATVRRLGGVSGQGFLFGRPLAAEAAEMVLADGAAHQAHELAA